MPEYSLPPLVRWASERTIQTLEDMLRGYALEYAGT